MTDDERRRFEAGLGKMPPWYTLKKGPAEIYCFVHRVKNCPCQKGPDENQEPEKTPKTDLPAQ